MTTWSLSSRKAAAIARIWRWVRRHSLKTTMHTVTLDSGCSPLSAWNTMESMNHCNPRTKRSMARLSARAMSSTARFKLPAGPRSARRLPIIVATSDTWSTYKFSPRQRMIASTSIQCVANVYASTALKCSRVVWIVVAVWTVVASSPGDTV